MNNFVIKNVFCDGGVNVTTDVRWLDFVKAMNEEFRASWNGDSINCYYGVIDGRADIYAEFDSSVEVITLDEWIERWPQREIETIIDYHGNTIPKRKARQFSQDSGYADSWFHEDEYLVHGNVRFLDYGDGYAHIDECSETLYGCWFMTDYACDHNLVYSNYNDGWICETDSYTYYGYVDSSNHQEFFYNEDYVRAGSEYYADSYVAEQHGWVWSDRYDEYRHEDDYDEEDIQDNNAIYHRLERQFRFTSNPKFSIGFEIEKEDSDAGLIYFADLYNSTGWCKEQDGSLNNSGYELVSPAFDLYNNDLEKEIKLSNDLQTLINGGFSSRCGGHINIASSEFPNTEHLFEALSGFFPLLYAIYPNRIHEDFCRAKKKHEYYQKAKRSAIHIKDNVVEFRIFPAVRNYNNLIWRRDLMRIMCDNVNKSEGDVLKMLINSNSKLHKHMRKIYSHDALIERIERFIDHSLSFNNKKLNKIDLSKKKEIVASGVNTDDLAC